MLIPISPPPTVYRNLMSNVTVKWAGAFRKVINFLTWSLIVATKALMKEAQECDTSPSVIWDLLGRKRLPMNLKLSPQKPPSGLVPSLGLPDHCSYENKYISIIYKLSKWWHFIIASQVCQDSSVTLLAGARQLLLELPRLYPLNWL